MVITDRAGVVEDFKVIFLTRHQRKPRTLLGRESIPYLGIGDAAARRQRCAANTVDVFGICGDPEFRRIVAREPEVIIAGLGRHKITTEALARIIAVIDIVFEGRQERVVRRHDRRGRDHDVGYRAPGSS